MKHKPAIVLMWIFALLPLLLVFLALPFLPEQIPTSWGFDGQVTYSGKNTLWLLAAISPIIALLYQFLPRIDPKRSNYARFQSFYDGFGIAIPLFLLFMLSVTLVESFRPGTLNVGRVVTAAVSVLFLVLGTLMGKLKPNWFVGIRTPWTLADPDVWTKTHRLGGWTFFLTGLMNLPLALLAPEPIYAWAFFLLLFGAIALTIFMSWYWYSKLPRA